MDGKLAYECPLEISPQSQGHRLTKTMFDFFRRRRIRKAFEPYVGAAMAQKLVQSSSDDVHAFRELCADIAMVALSAPNPKLYSECAGHIADFAQECGGLVHRLVPIIVVTFEINTGLSNFISRVRDKAPEVAIVIRKNVIGSLGNIGSDSRFDFGFWWAESLETVRQLMALSPGDMQEFGK